MPNCSYNWLIEDIIFIEHEHYTEFSEKYKRPMIMPKEDTRKETSVDKTDVWSIGFNTNHYLLICRNEGLCTQKNL
jgi:hypothetical protein